jgi:general secretion pathway protein C
MQQLDGIKKFFAKIPVFFRSLSAKKISELRTINFRELPQTIARNVSAAKFNNYTLYYNCVAIIICAYFVADFFATALSPFIPAAPPARSTYVAKPPKNLAAYNQIFTRNLFNEKGLIPEIDDLNSDSGPPVKTSLPLNLLGVIVVHDELKSVASVEDRGSNQVNAVRVNEYITPDTLVQKIETNKVIFFNRSSGRREFIDLPNDFSALTTRKNATVGAGIQKSSDNHYTIDRGEVDKALANINQILTEARCVPNIENGRPNGYRCFQIVPGSIYDKLGMKDNDVICGLNGEPVNDPGKAFEVFSQLKSLNSIDICINRNGQVMNMNYDIH